MHVETTLILADPGRFIGVLESGTFVARIFQTDISQLCIVCSMCMHHTAASIPQSPIPNSMCRCPTLGLLKSRFAHDSTFPGDVGATPSPHANTSLGNQVRQMPPKVFQILQQNVLFGLLCMPPPSLIPCRSYDSVSSGMFRLAAARGDIRKLELIARRMGPRFTSPDCTALEGWTPLHAAAAQGQAGEACVGPSYDAV